jgi:hypothetical protein
MANEITVNLKLSYANGTLVGREDPGTFSVDQTGKVSTGGAQTIATNATTINMGSVTTAGYAYFRNVSTANFIEIGTGTGTSFVAFSRLNFGQAQIVRMGTNAPTAKADTAAGTLQYTILSA